MKHRGDGEPPLPRGTVTLLLADVEGSTRLWERDAAQASSAMSEFDALVDELVTKFDGARPHDQGEGDSFLAAFARASAALMCAIEIQCRLGDGPVRVRMGLHTGEVEVRDESRYDGPTIIRAARIRDLGHGGQVLVSSATRDLLVDNLPDGVDLIDLGPHSLKGLARPETVHQIVHPELARAFPPLRSTDTRAAGLPVQLKSFIGRTKELEDVRRLITENRLVTLTGAGGCGKTRLAIEAVAQLSDEFPDGVWFCDLGPLADPLGVPQALRSTLGLNEEPGRTDTEVVWKQLGDANALVVIDNCEHLIDASAELADALLRQCPNLRVLTTSREPVGVEGEIAWRVPSLDAPDDGAATPEELASYDAIRLFVERAERVRPNFALNADNARGVTEICTRLDGIPLAIELAAARVRVLSVQQIVDGLNDRFRLLGRGARTVLARQQTLLASVGWSHDLLSEQQQVALRRLAVFTGPFELEGAEHVVSGDGIDAAEVLELVAQLTDRSLLVIEESAPIGTRYRMLETIRQFARDRLVDSGEAAAVAGRHLDYYLQFVSNLVVRRFGQQLTPDEAIGVANAAYENIRTACEWAIADGRNEPGLDLISALVVLIVGSQTPARGRELKRWVRDLLRDTSQVRVGARINGLLTLSFATGFDDSDEAARLATEALELARETGDRQAVGMASTLLGLWLGMIDPERGLPYLEEGAAIASELGNPWMRSAALSFLIQVDGVSGSRAMSYSRELLDIAERSGLNEPFARMVFGILLISAGDVVAGRCELETALASFEARGNLTWVAKTLGSVSMVLALQGERSEARILGERAASLSRQLEGDPSFVMADLFLAQLETADGRFDEAERLLARVTEVMRTLPEGAFAHSLVAATQTSRAVACLMRGRTEEARSLIAEAAPRALSGSWDIVSVPALSTAASIARALGEIAEAESYTSAALGKVADDGPIVNGPDLLDLAALLRADVGSDADAVRLIAAAASARTRMQIVRQPNPVLDFDTELAAIRGRLGDEVFAEAWTAGEALTLEDAIEFALRGRGPRQRPQVGWDSLTPTELKVVSLVREGLSNPQIAGRMFVSPRTVSTHLSHVFAKLGVSSRSELASAAAKRGVSSE